MSDIQQDVLTDHAYDGIQEYDNPMPGWWVWSFIITIVFAFPYWAWYHLADGHSLKDEYAAQIAEAEALAPKLDESKEAMLGYLEDQDVLMRGAKTFSSICAACHFKDGGGLVGPNMTDDYYLHVRDITDFLTVIRNGVPEKGMASYEGTLRQQQIVQVAAYMASLRGTTPENPKEPQGEIIPPWK